MTCSNCNARGHNKRGCPQSVESREESSNTGRERDQPSGSGRGKGRPKKPTTEGEPPAKRGRGRPRKTTAVPSASPPPTVPPAYPAPSAPPPPTATRAHPPPIAPIDYPISSSAPPDFVSSLPSTSKRGRGKGMGRGRGSTTTYKRPPIMGMGIFQAENGFKAINPGMPSCKIFSTGATKVTRSADITGDIGFKPSTASKLKWNGKASISTRKLQEISEQRRKKNPRESSSNNPSQFKEPWKL